MVKNVTGGNNNKKFARKHSSVNAKAGIKLRVSEDEGELYAVVTKNLGNNMFHACSTNSTTYLCHIRGKFSGRGRRDNTIACGVWVLIGLREWDNKTETKGGKVKLQQSDLLEVYSELDKVRLKESIDEDWDVLIMNDPSIVDKSVAIKESEIVWQTDKDMERDKLIEELNTGKTTKISLDKKEEFDAEIYAEDI
jgi:translation initiation factor IF-1